MIKYKPRLTAADMPENDNKYYIRKADGGYSPCINGNPKHKYLTALSNCVGWAIGRFMEILQTTSSPLGQYNAEDFYNNAKLPKGQVPKNGAIICWKQGSLWNSNDGAGHVAVVEKVISEDEIITSESAYGGMAFYTKHRKKGDGDWGASSSYKLMGFIYPPEECVPEDEAQTYTVTVENIPTKAEAEEMLTEAKFKGYSGFITEPENPEPEESGTAFAVGDKVKVKEGAKDYKGNPLASFVYKTVYTVMEIGCGVAPDYIVIGNGKQVTAAVHSADLIKV